MLGMVNTKTGDAYRRAVAIHRQLILPIAVLLGLAAVALAGLIVFNARNQDLIARTASIEAIEEGLNERAGQLNRVVKDYAWWTEAFEAIQLRADREWATQRLGPYLYGTHEYEWAFVIAPDDTTFFAALLGEPVVRDISSALGGEQWRGLVTAARAAVSNDEPHAVHAFVPMGGDAVAIASATTIVPEDTWTGPRPRPSDSYVLVVVRRLTELWLEELGNALNIDGLTFTTSTEPPDTGVVLRGPDQAPVGRVAWRAARPGTDFVLALLPSLGISLILFAAFGWSALRQSRSSTSAIVESETRFRDVADASSDWIFETDAEGRLTWISERFIALTGITLGDIEGRPIAELLLPMAGEDLSIELDNALCERRLFRSIPRCYLDREGRPRALRVSGKPTRDEAGHHIGWRGTATDVTVEIEARKTAEFLSGHDALTGILNRQGVIDGTNGILATAAQRGQIGAFLMLDLDGFKEVNDIYGPIVGDQLIRAVAQHLAALAQPGDVVGRPGADEFVLARLAVNDAQAAQQVARGSRTRWRSRSSSTTRRSPSASASPRSCCRPRPTRPSGRCRWPAW